MALTAEQTRALIDAIASAASLDVLSELRREVRREYGFDVRGGFVELLIDVQQAKLARTRVGTGRGTDAGRARPA
jgi:hypothetical protein